MSPPGHPADDEVAVLCQVCNTRLYAATDLIGERIRCPECDAWVRVKAPPPKPVRVVMHDDGDEYRLAESDHIPPLKPTIKLTCGTCMALVHADFDDVGKEIACPDCGRLLKVPAPKAVKPRFQAPDASDVYLDAAPAEEADARRKEVADRLMAEANEYVQRRHAERPIPPKEPLKEGIYRFPFYSNVLPLWTVAAIGALVNLALLDVIIDVSGGRDFAMVFVAFLVPILAVLTGGLLLALAPHYLTIIEETADGRDRISAWESQDILSRGQAFWMAINAVAMSTAPGMLIVGLLKPVGVPLWFGFISTILLLPFVTISMLENDSIFLPYCRRVFASFNTHRSSWLLFFAQGFFALAVLLAIDFLVWFAVPVISRYTAVLSIAWYSVFYTRLIGRIAWVIGPDEDEDKEEEDDEDDDDQDI